MPGILQSQSPESFTLSGWLTLALLFVLPAVSLATTLLSMSIDEVTDNAELIFEGEVIDHVVRRESGSGLIHTYVTFRVRDVIKGDFPGDSLELRFTGGQYQGEIVAISGLSIPEIGEQGIYFVESSTEPLLNPLLGWSQGRYPIEQKQDGQRLVNTAAGTPIIDIQPVSRVPTAIRRPQALIEGETNAATGVVADQSPLSVERALSVEEFKQRIRALLD